MKQILIKSAEKVQRKQIEGKAGTWSNALQKARNRAAAEWRRACKRDERNVMMK